MIDQEAIREVCRQIAERYHPQRIVLFGSYANGNPTPDSDVDLLVIMQVKGSESHQSAEIMGAIQPRIPIDLLVRTPSSLARRVRQNDYFLKDILDKGRVLYEAPHA